MFLVNFLGKPRQLPYDTIYTQDVFDFILKDEPSKKKNFSLIYNSIFLNKKSEAFLIDIGYDPHERLELINIKQKKIFFSLNHYNYLYAIDIKYNFTCFDAQSYFAKEFFTVPQNIFIKHNDEIIPDDSYLFKFENTEEDPFIIHVADGYHIYNVLLDKLFFICMKDGSKLIDLKSALSAYFRMNLQNISYKKEIKTLFSGSNLETINNADLLEISKKMQIFDFEYIEKDLGKPFKITVTIETCKEPIEIEYELYNDATIYTITCFLERDYHIDRGLFVAYSEDGSQLKSDFKIRFNYNTHLYFKKFKTLHVKINEKVNGLSIFTSIQDLKMTDKFENHNFGVIINNHFVHDSTGKLLLIECLNNYDDKDKMTKITLNYSKQSCHIRTFSELSHDKSQILKKYKFIVPDNMELEKVTNLYLHRPLDSIKIVKNDGFNYEFIESANRTVKYLFTDENNETKVCSVNLSGNDLRVMDLVAAVYKEIRQAFNFKKAKYDMFGVTIKNRHLRFFEKLSDVIYDKDNMIEIKGLFYQEGKTSKEIYVRDYINIDEPSQDSTLKGNYMKSYQYEMSLTSNDIIDRVFPDMKNRNENHRIFMEFMELKPTDMPTIFKQRFKYVILNSLKDKLTITVSNGTELKISFNLDKEQFEKAGSYISQIFKLNENQINFSYIFNSKETILPPFFNAAALPDGAEIKVSYNYEKKDQIFFLYEGKIVSVLVDHDETIKNIKSIVQKKLKIWNLSLDSFYFSFSNFILDKFDCKQYSTFKIPHKAVININKKKDIFPVHITTADGAFNEDIYFTKNESSEDIINHLKRQFDIDYRIELKQGDKSFGFQNLLENKSYNFNFNCKKAHLFFQGSLGDKEIAISEVVTVSNAIAFIKKKYVNEDISIFTYNDLKKCFEKVDYKKRLNELKKLLLVHKVIPDIQIMNFPVCVRHEECISECNRVRYLKNNYISKKILTLPQNIILTHQNGVVDDSRRLYDIVKDKLNIEYKYRVIDEDEKPNKISKMESDLLPPIIPIGLPPMKPLITPPIESKKNPSIGQNINQNRNSSKSMEIIFNQQLKRYESEPIKKPDESEIDKFKTQSVNISKKPKVSIKKFKPKISKVTNDDNDDNDNQQAPKEEENSNEKVEYFKCKFQIIEQHELTLELTDKSTVNDTMTLISNMKGKINPNNIFIFHDYAILKNDILIKDVRPDVNDALQVFILPQTLQASARNTQKPPEVKIYDSNFIKQLLENKIVIGHGGQSIVYKVNQIHDSVVDKDNFWAVKKIDFNNDNDNIKRFFREYLILKILDHPNIVKVYGVFLGNDEDIPCIVLEYCNSSLDESINKLTKIELIRIIYEICHAMKYVHEAKFIHRDLKPQNILLDANNHAKLGDFGIATLIEGSHSNVGTTIQYMAPEFAEDENNNYTEKIDVYSFGCILYFILSKRIPPNLNYLINEKMPKIPKDINKVSADLIYKCLSKSPEDRPSFNEIISYIKENGFNLIDGIDTEIPSLLNDLKDIL